MTPAKFSYVLLISFLLLLFHVNLKADLYWVDTGLMTDKVTSIVVDDNDIIYCSTSKCKIYKYEWGTIGWDTLKSTIGYEDSFLAIDNNGNLYTDAFGKNPFKSTDNGKSWDSLITGLTYLFDKKSIIADGKSDNIFLFMKQDYPFQLFKLDNNSYQSWYQVNRPEDRLWYVFDYNYDNYNNMYLSENYLGDSVYYSLLWKYDNLKDTLYPICDTLQLKYIGNFAINPLGEVFIITNDPEDYEEKLFLEKWNYQSKSWDVIQEIKSASPVRPTIVKMIFINDTEFLIGIKGGIGLGNINDYNIKNISTGLDLTGYHMISCIYVAKNGYVYLGTTKGQVFVSSEKVVGVKDSDNNVAGFGISPNPASDYINIQFVETCPRPVSTDIKIYNVIGECVKTEPIHPMTASHRMNIEDLPSGIYFIRIGNNVSEIKRGMFVKE